MKETNAAVRSIVKRDTGQTYQESNGFTTCCWS